MMKQFILNLLLIAFLNSIIAQETPYFQQEVNYKIEVKLDDKNHSLSGNIEIEYINNSPDDLEYIYMHLWGNAYKDINTAFAKQQLRTGNTKFYFAKDNDFGFFEGLDFNVSGETLKWKFDKEHPDIAKVNLREPLKSGEKITIATPFILKIPSSYSRLGHDKESYAITQWYPKPAVYDKDGWHEMPYFDMGEFYSEFGTFDVKITLPENYVVGATGVLQNESEKEFLKKKVAETQAYFGKRNKENTSTSLGEAHPYPPSSANFKTIHFKAENIHDFAWFADKRFQVQKSEVVLPSGKKVDTWTMFSNEEANLWEKSIDYVNRSVKFYSEKVGEYPWPHATAVYSTLEAGGGMEYPMITVIGESLNAKGLDDVITHEVGHNWFYGILAFNERDHPWMDEGINSYYEYRYMSEYYDNYFLIDLPNVLTGGSSLDLYEVSYLYQARQGLDQAPETHSDHFSNLNYGLSAYVKPGLAFGHLEHYLGTENFDDIMHSFYNHWKFRHPQPQDFRDHFEKESGRDLTWFFEGYINSNRKLDYQINGISQGDQLRLDVQNKGDMNAPIPLSGLKDGEIVETKWYEGFEGKKELDFPNGDYDQIIIDAKNASLDINRKNNNLKMKGLLKKVEPLKLKFLAGIETPRKTQIFWTPTIAWNAYDKTMLGMAIYNSTIPERKFEYVLAPMYSFNSKDLNGVGTLKYNIYPKGKKIRKISLGLGVKSYNISKLDSLKTEEGFADTHLKFLRVAPSIKVQFKTDPSKNLHHYLQFRSLWINSEQSTFELQDTNFVYLGNEWQDTWIHQLSYVVENRRALNPLSLRIDLEQQKFNDDFLRPQDYVKASVELKTAYTYAQGRRVNFRFFAGAFLKSTFRNKNSILSPAFNATGQGFNDYRYDDLYFGRNEGGSPWAQQIHIREGGMKGAFGGQFSQVQGRSNSFIIAANLKAHLPQNLPFDLPIKPYLDLAYIKDARENLGAEATFKDQFWWSAGFMVDLADGVVAAYFPVLNSDNLKSLQDQFSGGKYFKKVTFMINLGKINPWELRERIEL